MEQCLVLLCGLGALIFGVLGEDGSGCKNVPNLTTKLRKELLCNYDSSVRPVLQDSSQMELRLLVVPVSISLIPSRGEVTVHMYVGMYWTDEFLTWNAHDYNGTKYIFLNPTSIWTPNIFPISSLADWCKLNANGDIICLFIGALHGNCANDLTLWPYDQQNCSLTIASMSYEEKELHISYREDIYLYEFSPENSWDLLEIDQMTAYRLRDNTSYMELRVSFLMKRHADSHKATLVMPAIVLSVLTLAVLWLEVGSQERICVSTMDIVCHCLYLQYLARILPSNGDSCPLIVLFFRDSLVLVVVSLLVTVVLHRMAVTTPPPPLWASNVVRAVLRNRLGQIVLLLNLNPEEASGSVLDEEGSDLLMSSQSKVSREWSLLATFIDRVFFLVYSLILSVLLISFVFY